MKKVQKRLWEDFLDPNLDHHSSSSDLDAKDSDVEESGDEDTEDDREETYYWENISVMVIRHEKILW